jgi:hypothetical protein
MKKIFTLLFFTISIGSFAQQAKTTAAFTAGNLVVYRVGDGSAALSSSATPIFLDEFTPTGTLVQSIPMPTTVIGANRILTAAGSSTSEGYITLSPNNQYLWIGGYDAAPGTATVASAASTNRTIGRVDASGTVNTSTYFTEVNGNIRGVTGASNGTDIWATTSSGGVRYLPFGNATTSTQLSTTPTNTRAINIFGGNLYITAASGAYDGVAQVGTGLPTTSGQTTTALNGFPTATGPSSYAFAMKPSGDVLYVADDRTTGAGGIQKWTLSAGTWTLQYTLAVNATTGARGLTVNWNTPNPTIYATANNSSGNTLVSVVDQGSAPGTFTTLATAVTNTQFRGVTFTPGTILPLNLTSFTATLSDNKVNVNWTTANEVNVAGYEIQRSVNGKDFMPITLVQAENAGTTKQYSYTDPRAVPGTSYYRLKMTDKDGSYKYSLIATIKTSMVGVSLYPNPVRSNLTIQHESADKGATVSIIGMSGKQLISVNLLPGAVQTTIEAAKLAPGVYMVVYTNNGQKHTKQFIKE